MYKQEALFPVTGAFYYPIPKLKTMTNYITEKNDRIRRRKAGVLTAVITLALLALAAYSFGAFDAFLAPEPAEVVAATVANA